nr:STAS domain-containing protein [Cellulosimicrobium sp. MM]
MDTGSAIDRTSGIVYAPADGGVVVTMWGEVDAALRDRASEAMSYVLDTRGRVVVDVADVTFIDSSGIAFIIQLYMLGEEDGREVVLRDPSPSIVELLDMIGMGGRIPVERSGASTGRSRSSAPSDTRAPAAAPGPRGCGNRPVRCGHAHPAHLRLAPRAHLARGRPAGAPGRAPRPPRRADPLRGGRRGRRRG